MTTLAKVVAMTTTHAALKRKEFMKISFEYDNVVMEEAAQILEIETLIPLTLQTGNRLKRLILIGDHHQLPPVVKNSAFAKYSHMDQSMFQRLIRLGVPHIQLNLQGRARPSIANLYSGHYNKDDNMLGDLPHVVNQTEYKTANAGFAHDFQLIDVDMAKTSTSSNVDRRFLGENCPTPHYYQNVAEAEFIVSCYQYMRLLGYPAKSISIITTYRGQKHLIRDVVRSRCSSHPAFGPPHRVTTVDKYQGQQNDYILLSLVRTKHVGHLRDVRRLIVALSRAKKGLYVFGKVDLFKQCPELHHTINLLLQFPSKLALIANEPFPSQRRLIGDAEFTDSDKVRPYFVDSPDAMHTIVMSMVTHWENLFEQQQQNVFVGENDANRAVVSGTAVPVEGKDMHANTKDDPNDDDGSEDDEDDKNALEE